MEVLTIITLVISVLFFSLLFCFSIIMEVWRNKNNNNNAEKESLSSQETK